MMRQAVIIYVLLFWITTPGIGQQWPESFTLYKTNNSIKLEKSKFSSLLLKQSEFKSLQNAKLLPRKYFLARDTLVAKQMYSVIYVNVQQSYDMIAFNAGDFISLFSIDYDKDKQHIVQLIDTTDITGDGVNEIFILLSSNSSQGGDNSFIQLWDPIAQTKLLEAKFGVAGYGSSVCTGIYGGYLNKLQFSFFRGGFSFDEYWSIDEDKKSREGIERGLTYLYTSKGFVVDRTKNCCKLYEKGDLPFEELKREYENLIRDKQNNDLCCEERLQKTMAELAFRGLAFNSTKDEVRRLLGPSDSILYNPIDLPWLPKYKEPVEIWLYKWSPNSTYYKIFSEGRLISSEFRASP